MHFNMSIPSINPNNTWHIDTNWIKEPIIYKESPKIQEHQETDILYLSSDKCASCHKPNPLFRCSKCKSVYYCDDICQKICWKTHKNTCTPIIQNQRSHK
jgi:hypothetical protein